jgi:hypothetical protein
MHRTAVANFTVDVAGTVRMSVTSSIHATPFFRVESCGGTDPGRFVASYSEAQGDSVTKAANLPIGHYFVIAGSSGGDSSSDPSAAERPESISIARTSSLGNL